MSEFRQSRTGGSPLHPGGDDLRPKTAVLITYSGIGDLVWHLPYFEAVAERSKGGRVTVVAAPSTLAPELLLDAPWVDAVLLVDHRPRVGERRKGRHQGPLGLWRMACELRAHQLERIVMFSGRASRAAMSWLAGIPKRAGYGFDIWGRAFLNDGASIQPYQGPAVAIYENATTFALANGWCQRPLVPRLSVSPDRIDRMRERLKGLPQRLCAFGIGTSEPQKQWGGANFSRVADALAELGYGVLLLGGRKEEELAADIIARMDVAYRSSTLAMCREHVLDTAAALTLSSMSLSNDTGVAQLAAACGIPSHVLLGNRPALSHDSSMRLIRGPSLQEVTPAMVLGQLCPNDF